MAYLVNVTARAEHDLALLYVQIKAEDSGAALKWYRGFKDAILNLEEQPNRCPVTPESDKFRHLCTVTSRIFIGRYTAWWKSRSRLKCCISATVLGEGSRGPMLNKLRSGVTREMET